jgi:hypothetical protein
MFFTVQTSLGQRRSFSSKASGAPDYRRFQQNQRVRFLLFQTGASSSRRIHVQTKVSIRINFLLISLYSKLLQDHFTYMQGRLVQVRRACLGSNLVLPFFLLRYFCFDRGERTGKRCNNREQSNLYNYISGCMKVRDVISKVNYKPGHSPISSLRINCSLTSSGNIQTYHRKIS